MNLFKDIFVKCEECGELYTIYKDEIEFDVVGYYERNMGDEIEYSASHTFYCENCNQEITLYCGAYEYPIGAINYGDPNIDGAFILDYSDIKIEHNGSSFDLNNSITKIKDFNVFERIDWTSLKVSEIIKKIQINTAALQYISSRQFEEVVAELFMKMGFNVKLTPQTRDGGKDIIVTTYVGFTPLVLYVECKHFSSHNKVSVELIRSLYGVTEKDKVNKSILITTSSFTDDAKAFAEEIKHRVDLVDGNDLISWLENYWLK